MNEKIQPMEFFPPRRGDGMSEPVTLVCQRADSPVMVEGSTFHRQCQICDAYVMVSPVGERLIAAGKVVGIVCQVCGFKGIAEGTLECTGFAATPEERKYEKAVPNYYRRRN